MQRGAVVKRRNDAERLIPHRRQHVLVGRRPAADQQDALLQSELLILPHELQRGPAEDQCVHRIDIA